MTARRCSRRVLLITHAREVFSGCSNFRPHHHLTRGRATAGTGAQANIGTHDNLIEVNLRRVGLVEETAPQPIDEWLARFHSLPATPLHRWSRPPMGLCRSSGAVLHQPSP